ncbi:hypothetical protein QJS10_CPB15g01747 [Acorus calamus]|uniref:3'-5' exonuclease domain-containing protein n=1 Tax=Acorus calamus TaxID=4465 RepID=A0AAV9D8S5_ACOCL|nr:hypothetical protein QJS10_CPB15g01747 [Acorus calamus]
MDRPPISIEELDYSETDFIVHFFNAAHIATVVTASSAQASLWVNQFLYAYQDDNNNTDDPTRFLVGLDVEWKSENGHEDNPVAVLQLCVDQHCLIFQILHCDAIPNALVNFLSDTRFTFTGSKIHGNVQRLITDYNVRVGNIMEIRTLLEERAYLRREELRLARDILIWKMQNPWSVQLGNWDEERLSLEQIMYACLLHDPFE